LKRMRLAPTLVSRRRSTIAVLEADAYCWRQRRVIELYRRPWWQRHLAWIGRQPFLVRVNIVLFWIAGATFALVAGTFIGLAVRFSQFGQ
jgi:hypothetical protein